MKKILAIRSVSNVVQTGKEDGEFFENDYKDHPLGGSVNAGNSGSSGVNEVFPEVPLPSNRNRSLSLIIARGPRQQDWDSPSLLRVSLLDPSGS